MSESVLSNLARAILDEPLPLDAFSVRTGGAFQVEGIVTWRDLATKSEQEVLRIPNIGRKSVKEMVDALARRGLSLGMELPPPATTKELELPLLTGVVANPLDEPGDAATTFAATYFVLEIEADSISQIFAKAFLGTRVPGRRVDLRILVTDGPGIVRHRFSGKVDLVSFARYTHEVLAGEETSLELTVLVANVDTSATLTCSRDGRVGRLDVQIPATAAT